jgi:small-conductance mechanosensitive channel
MTRRNAQVSMNMVKNNLLSKLSPFTRHSLESLRGGKKPVPKPCLAGTISSAWRVLLTESGAAWNHAQAVFRVSDLITICILAFSPEIILRFIHNRIINPNFRKKNPKDFEDTPYLAPIAAALCQIGQLALLVYFGELFIVFLSGLGVPHLQDKPRLLATLVYTVYTMKWVCRFKDKLVNRSFRKLTLKSQRQNSSRKLLYSRALDATIYFIGTLLFLDANNIDVGVALKSLLTVGGISSVVIGFALKEPVTEIIQGTSVLLSNKFITGDTIRLSDGTCGKVQRFEWTDVTIQGDDNSFVRVPHSQLAKSRIVNMSRMPCSRVTQEITLPNRGSKKIQQVLADIKAEIQKNCDELVDEDDGGPNNQSFLVHWTDFVKPDSVVIKVQCHFRIPQLSDQYWSNRQQVLFSINRAVEKYNS